MSEGLKNPAPAEGVQVNFRSELRCVDDRDIDIWMEKDKGAVKVRRGYADDCERMLVQLDDAADGAAVILKTSVLVRIAENDVWSAVGALLIGGMNQPTEIRLNA